MILYSKSLGLSLGIMLTLAFSSSSIASEIYKWVGANGRIHYSNQKPDDPQEVKTLHFKEDYKAPERVLPVIPENAMEESTDSQAVSALPGFKGKGSGTVIMYSTAWCGYCKKARNYFRQNRIPFNEYDIEKSARAKAEHKRLGGSGVPFLIFGKHKMRGFSSGRFEKLYYQ